MRPTLLLKLHRRRKTGTDRGGGREGSAIKAVPRAHPSSSSYPKPVLSVSRRTRRRGIRLGSPRGKEGKVTSPLSADQILIEVFFFPLPAAVPSQETERRKDFGEGREEGRRALVFIPNSCEGAIFLLYIPLSPKKVIGSKTFCGYIFFQSFMFLEKPFNFESSSGRDFCQNSFAEAGGTFVILNGCPPWHFTFIMAGLFAGHHGKKS